MAFSATIREDLRAAIACIESGARATLAGGDMAVTWDRWAGGAEMNDLDCFSGDAGELARLPGPAIDIYSFYPSPINSSALSHHFLESHRLFFSMAARFGVSTPALLAVFCCLVFLADAFGSSPLPHHLNCGNGSGCFCAETVATESLTSRKLLVGFEKHFKGFGSDTLGWEMRTVPSGPDPLHHNRSPKKPQTP
ncbi:hypothetical protein ACLOJK_006025 [Asimina triloba]